MVGDNITVTLKDNTNRDGKIFAVFKNVIMVRFPDKTDYFMRKENK